MSVLNSPAARRVLSRTAPLASSVTASIRSLQAHATAAVTTNRRHHTITGLSTHVHTHCRFEASRHYSTTTPKEATGQQPEIVPRSSALETLKANITAGNDLKQVQATVLRMQQDMQLQTTEGHGTRNVIQDAAVVELLATAIERQAVWEDAVDLLDLILAVRPSSLGKQYMDGRISTTGYVADSELVDETAIQRVLEACLASQFALTAERELAGLTALQVMADYGLEDRLEFRALRIRALGYASNVHALRLYVKAQSAISELGELEKFELGLAYARCLDYDAAMEILRQHRFVSRQNEAQAALTVCLAETARFDEAIAHWEEVVAKHQQQQAEANAVTGFHVQLAVVGAAIRSVLPRLAFTQNFHTSASTRFSAVYSEGLAERVLRQFAMLRAQMRQELRGKQWQETGLARALFDVECLAYVLTKQTMAQTVEADHVSVSMLSKRLHSHLVTYGSMRPLRAFLWAVALAPQLSQRKKLGIMQSEIAYAQKHVAKPLLVADLEPALVAAMPPAVWTTSRRGNFRDASAFVPSDEFLQSPAIHSLPHHPFADEVLELAARSSLHDESDGRLVPLRVWIAVLQGRPQQAMAVARELMGSAPVRVMPGSLALVNARSPAFYEQMFCALSMLRRGSDLALSQLLPLMQAQQPPVNLTSRVAAAILYCCVTSRSLAVARAMVERLKEEEMVESPRILELMMRIKFVSGQTTDALAGFRELMYASRATPVGEPSFAMVLRYMGANRASVVGAEHAFAAYMQIMGFQGKVSAAVWEQWQKLGVSREATRLTNMFAPEPPLTIGQALADVGVERRAVGEMSSRRFMRDWEYVMVMELVAAYINCGVPERAAPWEAWVLEALRVPKFRLKPALVARTVFVQKLHLKRDDGVDGWDGTRMCLDYVIAIDRNLNSGKPRSESAALGFRNQQSVYKALAARIARSGGGSGSALGDRIKQYLEKQDAGHIFKRIQK